jgi:hypothetical protein
MANVANFPVSITVAMWRQRRAARAPMARSPNADTKTLLDVPDPGAGSVL